MKILYVSLIEDIRPSSGVFKKMIAKVNALNQLEGIVAKGISISSEVDRETLFNEHFKILPYKKTKIKYFFSTISRRRKLKVLADYLRKNSDKYDIILMRYYLGSVQLYRIIKTYSYKIVFEHNSKELEEIKLLGQSKWQAFSANLRPGYFLTYLESFVFVYCNEKVFGQKLLKQVKYGIAVTNEIAKYEESRAKGYKCFTISNSIDTSLVKLNIPLLEKLNMVMILSSEYSWHGINRLLSGFKAYKGKEKVKISIIGNVQNSTMEYIKSNKLDDFIKIYPPHFGEQLDELMSSANIGIGSLSLFKVKLGEASPLKTRDYLARGLPVVVGYHDTDLENQQKFEPYYLSIPADDSPLDFEKVINFYNRVYQIPNVNKKIRDLALIYLDTKVKMKELISIFKS